MTHRTHRIADESGWRASCTCGWQCTHDSQISRDIAADAHRDYAGRRPWPKAPAKSYLPAATTTRHDARVRIKYVDIDDAIGDECQRRAGGQTWNQLVNGALLFALTEADRQDHGIVGLHLIQQTRQQ